MNINPGLKDTIAGSVSIRALDSSTDSILSVPKKYAVRYDDTGTGIVYIGKAVPGSSESNPVWQLIQWDKTLSPDFSIKFADGNDSFDNTWSGRASKTYT